MTKESKLQVSMVAVMVRAVGVLMRVAGVLLFTCGGNFLLRRFLMSGLLHSCQSSRRARVLISRGWRTTKASGTQSSFTSSTSVSGCRYVQLAHGTRFCVSGLYCYDLGPGEMHRAGCHSGMGQE